MKKYRFTVKYTDGKTKDFDFDDYSVAMRKQAEFVKKAMKSRQFDEVGGVKPINESKKQVVRLNESQLNRVIKESVKKVLKENKNESDNKYIVKFVEGYMIKDSYRDGETGDSSWWSDRCSVVGNSIKDVVEKTAKQYGFDEQYTYVFDDTIRIQMLTDKDNYPLSESDIEQWKIGKIEAYSSELIFNVHQFNSIGHDELVQAGFESYD